MKPSDETKITLDVRAKLLVLLALLSLPLLIISLLQLQSYQKNINEQAASIARIETVAAAGALESWIKNHPALTSGNATASPEEAKEIYALVERHTTASADTSIAVFDARGNALQRAGDDSPASSPSPDLLPAGVEQQRWSDGMMRVTGAKRVEPSGWSVAVGVPLPERTPAGRGILLLTATWALTMLASCLIAVWAVGRFTNPLRRLASTASTFAEGNLQERVEVETGDEVGTLANSFNVMAGSLQSKFDAVKKQSAFLGEVLDSLPLGVVVLDAGLIVRKVNTAFAARVGRDASALTGRGLYEAAAGLAVLSDIVEDVRRTRRAFVNYSLPLELSSREGGKEGEEGPKYWDVILWPVKEQSEGRGDLIVILSEVSKRVRAEKLATAAFAAEKARAAELESVIKQMDEGVVIVDARGRYRVNPAAAHILGRKAGEFRDGVEALIVDMQLRDLNGRVLLTEETPISRASSEGEHVISERYNIVRADGAERVLAVGATPLNGDDGTREGVAAVFRDITEEVRSHDELVAAYERLREHDRLKSAFVANVSHELRTPLNVILGLCQLLARDAQLPLAPLQAEAVMRMQRNARSLLELVNDLLDYSRLEAGHAALNIETVNVSEVVREVLENFEEESREKNIRLSVEVSPELGAVRTDRRKLEQVLSNLVSNAIKFTAEGTVHVRAAAEGATRWRLEVADTGIGISGEALKYIFDGFRQVDDRLARAYNGVGLGLAITRKIVELLEGEITVESKQNEGSCFRINWPREARPRTGTGSLVSHAESPSTHGEAPARHMRVVR
ncbi:MAG: PAS domain-containing protein [Acidobacteria bacterium]|nr:PAS domain-containing protein [Acidobacteriota bacterium]